MLLLGLWRNWNNFDLVGGLYENTAQRVKMQELVVTMQLASLSQSKKDLNLLNSDFVRFFSDRDF